jgi:polysaccharide export outer membrane protein
LLACGCGGRATLADDVAAAGGEEAEDYEVTPEDLLDQKLSEDERQTLRELRTFQAGPKGDYRINTGDVLSIVFYGDPSVDRQVKVRPDGKISFPRVGDIPAAGLTPVELSTAISELYAEYLRNPEATVIVDELGNQVVYVMGEVFRPGEVSIHGQITLSQAVTGAGGWTTTGQLSSVMVVRRGGWDKPRAVRIDMKKILSGERLNYDIALQPFDIVYIPQTFIGDVGDFSVNFFDRVLLPPLNTIIRGYDAFNANTTVVRTR